MALAEKLRTRSWHSGVHLDAHECEEASAALERARVVVVLDAWEESDERRSVEWSRSDITHRITLTGPGLRKGFSGVSRDAARAAAAKAIEAGEV